MDTQYQVTVASLCGAVKNRRNGFQVTPSPAVIVIPACRTVC